jgi:hypothetical protein
MWVAYVRARRPRAISRASQPADALDCGHGSPRHIGPTPERLPIREDVQTYRLADQPTLPNDESPETNRADSLTPTTHAALSGASDASPPQPLSPSPRVLALSQASKEGSRVDQSARLPADEMFSGRTEPAQSAVDHEVVPESEIGSAEATKNLLPGIVKADELVRATAGIMDAENCRLPAETFVERGEARSTATKLKKAKTSSPDDKFLASDESDATSAAGAIDNMPYDARSDLTAGEVPAGEINLHIPNEPQPQALAGSLRPISKYRPRLRARPAAAAPRSAAAQLEQEQTGSALEAILLLAFLPGDWGISLAVLLSRADGMSDKLEIRVGGTAYSLLTIDARLFEPFEPPAELDIVGGGFAAETIAPPTRRWVRTKRDLHVFSGRAGVAGFASVPRALIGQENVILCRTHLAATARDCAKATGSAELQPIAGPGIPEGWQCFRAFRPKAPAHFGDASDIFLSLNPLPDAAIELSGGIASGRSTWIVGAPPTIRVLGADLSDADFTIDGRPASPADNDGWSAPGWDGPGAHTIRFGGLSRTYEIVEIDDTWPTWPTGDANAYWACGAKVSTSAQPAAFAFAGGARWLLGPCAGDVEFAAQTSAGIAIAAPRFQPVWVLPARTGHRFVRPTPLPFRAPPQMPRGPTARIQIVRWCNLLRGSSAPAEHNSKELWRQYRQLARTLRRRGR